MKPRPVSATFPLVNPAGSTSRIRDSKHIKAVEAALVAMPEGLQRGDVDPHAPGMHKVIRSFGDVPCMRELTKAEVAG